MANVQAALRQRMSALALSLSLALSIAAIFSDLSRAQDLQVKAQAAEPKLIGRFSTGDPNSAKYEGVQNQCFAISDDGKHVATMSGYGALWLWDVACGKAERRLEKPLPSTPGIQFFELAYLPDAQSLAVLKASVLFQRGSSLQFQMWNTANGKSLFKSEILSQPAAAIPIHQWNRPRISASGDGVRLAVGINTSSMEVDVFKVAMNAMRAAGQEVPQLPALYPPSSTTIAVFDVAKKRIVTSIKTEWGFAPFALSDDGKRLVIWDGSTAWIAIFDVDGPKKNMVPTTTFAAERCSILHLAFSADAKSVAATYRVNERKTNPQGVIQTSSDDIGKEMYVGTWEVASGKPLTESKLFVLRLNENGGLHHRPAMSADGRLAAGSADDKTLRIIDTSNGKEKAKLEIQDKEGGNGVVFSRDGRYVAVSTEKGEVLVWDLEPKE